MWSNRVPGEIVEEVNNICVSNASQVNRPTSA